MPSNLKVRAAITPDLKPTDLATAQFVEAIAPDISGHPTRAAGRAPVRSSTIALRYTSEVLFDRKTPEEAAGRPHRRDPHRHQLVSRRKDIRKMTDRTRYALVGAGNRAQMYVDAITERFADRADLVAWSDPNPGRLDYYEELLDRPVGAGPGPLRAGPAGVDDRRAGRADAVVVTSPDVTHAPVIVDCLQRRGRRRRGEAADHRRGRAARPSARRSAETGRQVAVTFNYRYSPRNTALQAADRRRARSATVTSVHFEWVLDTVHGADYFRRWHRDKANSGGLLVHKSTHHFDLVNWWLDDVAGAGVRPRRAALLRRARTPRRRGLGDRPRPRRTGAHR